MGYLLLIAVGLLALVVGAELLVRSGSSLAERLGIPPMIVGLTVVSVGTSMPEMAVGISASLQGNGSLAVGNIAGTNVMNLLFILGLSVAITPLALRAQIFKLDLPTMALAALVLLVLSLDGVLTRGEGALLLAIAIVYTAVLIVISLRRRNTEWRNSEAKDQNAKDSEPSEGSSAADSGNGGGRIVRDLVILLIGIVVVIFGAEWLVDGAVVLARNLGISDAVIGLTVVAIGTSAPELVTTLVSTIRGDRDLAIGNLIGSSVYNIAFILGVTVLVSPVTLNETLVQVDLPLMAAVTVLCFPVFFTGRRVSRVEGILFVLAYLAYLTYILVART